MRKRQEKKKTVSESEIVHFLKITNTVSTDNKKSS